MLDRLQGVISRAYKLPWFISFVFDPEIGAAYGIGVKAKLHLLRAIFRNGKQVETLSSVAEHLELAAAIMRVPRDVPGDVIECGCYRGGSAVSLSLVCRLVGRRLIVADSFEGLPPMDEDERHHPIAFRDRVESYEEGQFAASLETVKENLARYGDLGVCDFKVGFFHESLPTLDGPIVTAFLDVDLVESLKPCLAEIWPRLQRCGRIYVHEAEDLTLVGLMFDERWWRQTLDAEPPGFVGAGCGLPLAALEGSELGYAEKPAAAKPAPAPVP